MVVTVDVRGGGASFGVNKGQYSAEETRDAYDVTEWIAAQPWCDGNVGMYGRSYLGITQYFAASQAPPHLKAIFPEMAGFDQYAYGYAGGVFREASRFNWQLFVCNLDHSMPMVWKDEYIGPVAPVDGDDGPQLLSTALRAHRANLDWFRMIDGAPYRDSEDPISGERIHETRSACTFREAIEQSAIPIYHLAGWFDMFPETPCFGGKTSATLRRWSSVPGTMSTGNIWMMPQSIFAGMTTGSRASRTGSWMRMRFTTGHSMRRPVRSGAHSLLATSE